MLAISGGSRFAIASKNRRVENREAFSTTATIRVEKPSAFSTLRQGGGQLAVQPTKTTIAHHHHLRTRRGVGLDLGDDRFQ